MAWWREARFGIFVHWGLYSGLAGTWEGKAVGTRGGMEWIQNMLKPIRTPMLKRRSRCLSPSPDFAREWARLARRRDAATSSSRRNTTKDSPCTTSKAGDYNAGAKLNRDLVKEIVDAAQGEGLRVGFYHSVIDWHHDQYAYAKSQATAASTEGQAVSERRAGSLEVSGLSAPASGGARLQLRPVDVLWWDYSSQDFQGEEAWRASELMDLVRSKQPKIIMNNRLFRSPEAGWASMGTEGYLPRLDPRYGDFITPEQHIPATGMPGVDWETCMTMNTTWGYSEHDHAWKSDETLIRNLVDIASKGGNYLLNIGPKGDGSVPEESVRSLQAIGEWMEVNGEAIYATTASPFAKLEWGRCTQKALTGGNTRLYLSVFDWPKDGRLVVPGLENQPTKARILGDKKELPTTSTAGNLIISLPAAAPNSIATVVALDIEGRPRVTAARANQ